MYCVSVWGGALSFGLGAKVKKLHERIVRNLFLKFSDGECPFKRFSILRLTDIHRFHAAIHMFRIITLGELGPMADAVEIVIPNHTHNTRNRDALLPPFPRNCAMR